MQEQIVIKTNKSIRNYSKMRNLLVFNPVSGKKESNTECLGKIISELTKNGNEVTVYQTQRKGDAQNYIEKKEILGYDRLICCGGDGTLHEIINGVMKKAIEIPIGYIPKGSTNDYAKNLGITRKNAMQCLDSGVISRVDIGSVNGEFFNYVAAFGLFTNIPFITSQEQKNSYGYFAYLLEGIKQLTDVSPKHIKFCVNEVWTECDIILGMITNSFSVGGIKNFNRKKVQLDDGALEYLFVKFPQNITELQTVISLLLSEKIDERYMYYGQFHSMQIESELLEWTLDGEYGGTHKSISIITYPKAVRIIHNA